MRSFWVDVNVWLALSSDRYLHYETAHRWFGNVGPGGAAFCRFTQLGYLRLLTNARAMGRDVLNQAGAWRVYDTLCQDARVTFVSEPLEVESAFRRLTQRRDAAINVWTDAYLAALAKTRGLTIVSFDQGFRSLDGVDTLILSN